MQRPIETTFFETAKKYSEEQITKISIVYSVRRRFSRNSIERMISSTIQYIKGRLEERNLSRIKGIPILSVRNVKTFWFCQRIRNDRHGVLAGFNQILKRPTISRPKSLVNFYPSILPYYRGAEYGKK